MTLTGAGAGARGEGVPALLDDVFRREAGRITAALVRRLGTDRLELAEDAVQEAMLRALRSWPFHGIPDNPAAWLATAARNHAVDALRRGRTSAAAGAEVADALHGLPAGEAADEHLQMLFMCCHPALPPETQLVLTLRSVMALPTAEIARTLLESEATVAQRLVRARRRLVDEGIVLEMPPVRDLPRRARVVLPTLYLAFTAGHSAMTGDQLLRPELCGEAIRLATLVALDERTASPSADALLALMYLTAARLPARMDEHGLPVRLRDQDRSRWVGSLVRNGFGHLERAMRGDALTAWHVEAEIASIHALAPSFEETDWRRIVRLYDRLHRLAPGPLVALNREVARHHAEGPAAALTGLRRLETSLARYYPYHLALADALDGVGRADAAARARRRALSLAVTEPVRRWIAGELGRR